MKRVYLAFAGIWDDEEIEGMKSCVKSLGIKTEYTVTINPNGNQIVYIDYVQPQDKKEEDLLMSALEDAVCGIVYLTEFDHTELWEDQIPYFDQD
jgi:hypothetical protein